MCGAESVSCGSVWGVDSLRTSGIGRHVGRGSGGNRGCFCCGLVPSSCLCNNCLALPAFGKLITLKL